jgi:hypothetical protein
MAYEDYVFREVRYQAEAKAKAEENKKLQDLRC